MGIVWGNPLLLTSLYGLIHAEYWPGWRKVQKKYWNTHFRKQHLKIIQQSEINNSTENFLPVQSYDDIVLSKNAMK
jgi:hypothetical protein